MDSLVIMDLRWDTSVEAVEFPIRSAGKRTAWVLLLLKTEPCNMIDLSTICIYF